MQGDQYLVESEKTLAPQDDEQCKVDNEFLLDTNYLMRAGNMCDRLKRLIYYKADINDVNERYDRQDKRIQAIVENVPPLLDQPGQLSQKEMNLLHAALGIGSEAGELMEEVISSILENREVDAVNMKEEVGDLLWYLAVVCRDCGFTFEQAMETNIEKLAKRYPNKFTTTDAVNRDVEAEREILEK